MATNSILKASTVYAEIALRARVGKCSERGLGLEWYARGAFVFDTAYITYASEKAQWSAFSLIFRFLSADQGQPAAPIPKPMAWDKA